MMFPLASDESSARTTTTPLAGSLSSGRGGPRTAIVLALWAVSGWATETEGKIHIIDASDGTIVLSNSTKLSVAEGVALDTLRQVS
jgi:hypothetical protein